MDWVRGEEFRSNWSPSHHVVPPSDFLVDMTEIVKEGAKRHILGVTPTNISKTMHRLKSMYSQGKYEEYMGTLSKHDTECFNQ